MPGAIVTHCGVGAPKEWVDSAEEAGKAGLDVLADGGTALDAVEAAVAMLEDDERLNAGIGSRYQLDGVIRMDAAMMDSDLECGAVAAIQDVRHPISVARRVMDSPHVLLVGEGATSYARKEGFDVFDVGTESTKRRLVESKQRLSKGKLPEWAARWKGLDWRDTVGAAARDGEGRFAVGCSTGGTTWMLPGRVGDTPIIGAGLYAGPSGAVTATGIGEEIVRQVLSKRVYDDIAGGLDVQRACEQGLALYSESVPMGVIAITQEATGASHNREMPWWIGTVP